jgi:hypothetical protein
MADVERRARRTRAHWQALIARAEASGQSIPAFCRAEGIRPRTFYGWRARLNATGRAAVVAPTSNGAARFLDLGTLGGEDARVGPWDLELELGAGVILRLRHR